MTRSENFSFLFNINNISTVLIDKDMYILKIKTASLFLKIILMKKKHLVNVIYNVHVYWYLFRATCLLILSLEICGLQNFIPYYNMTSFICSI